jgi:cytochrome c
MLCSQLQKDCAAELIFINIRMSCRNTVVSPETTQEAGIMKSLVSLAAALAWLALPLPASALDVSAAEALAKKSNCMKCHSVSAKKEGPSFKETAAKYKGKSDAEQKLATHLTTGPKIKVDGVEEEHANLKTKNDAEVLNVVQWILSQ